jgi:hypothetical protein
LLWLHIAGLWALAVAQPLFGLLGANAEFFVAHRAQAADILFLTLILAAIFPLLLACMVWLAGLAGRRAGTVAFNVVLAGLTSILAMQIAIRGGASTWLTAVPLAAAVGAAGVVAYGRWSAVRMFCTVLSAAALIVPGVFLLNPRIQTLVFADSGDAGAAPAPRTSMSSSGRRADTPVVLVVFDELPLVSLLDANEDVDPLLYPNFSALKREGLWFRNATTVDAYTHWALPAIASGTYPRRPALPSATDYPNTLFTLLGRSHRLEVAEPVTQLCPKQLCSGGEDTSLHHRLRSMGEDLRVVFLRLVLPPDLAAGLPDPTVTWAGFGKRYADSAANNGDEESRESVAEEADVTEEAAKRWQQVRALPRVTPALRFIDGISADDPQPTFYFLHTLVSHQPHHMLPGGKENKTWVKTPNIKGNDSGSWVVAQDYQRHLLQVGFVDDLLGRLITRLKDVGLYDRAMIVITSDHGISYSPDASRRRFRVRTAAEIMRVPLIVKLPAHLAVPEGVTNLNAEVIDILPTIADALGIQVPWGIDGTSLLDPARPERKWKSMFTDPPRQQYGMDANGTDVTSALRRKLELFGDGAGNPHRAPVLAGFNALLGQRVENLRVTQDGGPVELIRSAEYEHVDVNAPAVVFDVAGRFPSARPDTRVAVAVNGVVEAVTRTWESDPRGWLATPRFGAWRQGRNTIEVFIIERDKTGPVLRRTSPIGSTGL